MQKSSDRERRGLTVRSSNFKHDDPEAVRRKEKGGLLSCFCFYIVSLLNMRICMNTENINRTSSKFRALPNRWHMASSPNTEYLELLYSTAPFIFQIFLIYQ